MQRQALPRNSKSISASLHVDDIFIYIAHNCLFLNDSFLFFVIVLRDCLWVFLILFLWLDRNILQLLFIQFISIAHAQRIHHWTEERWRTLLLVLTLFFKTIGLNKRLDVRKETKGKRYTIISAPGCSILDLGWACRSWAPDTDWSIAFPRFFAPSTFLLDHKLHALMSRV